MCVFKGLCEKSEFIEDAHGLFFLVREDCVCVWKGSGDELFAYA